MTGHRQEMLNVTLTVAEVWDALDRAVLTKYKFLTEENNWELQEFHTDTDNINGMNDKAHGASAFYVREIPVVEDAAPLKELDPERCFCDKLPKVSCGNGKCLNRSW